MILTFLTWLAQTPWSIALHESQYLWPVTESVHVLTLALFAGSTMMMDLRLLGLGFPGLPVSTFTERLLPWTRAGFGVMVLTGVMLFYAQPVNYYQSLFFRLKVILLVIAGVNIFAFHSRIHARLGEWEHDAQPPRAARIAAMVSLAAWAGVIVSGRLIAYNWFSCDIQPQPAWINWAQQCILVPPMGTP